MNKHSKGIAHLFLLVVIVLIGIGGLLYYSWQKGLIKTTPTSTEDETASQAPNGDLANWETYYSENKKFSFKYPPNATLIESNIGATVIIPGDKPMFEVEDAGFINITFESLPKNLPRNNLPLKELVGNELNSVKPENDEILSELTEITLNGYRGYTYSTRDKIAFGFDTKYIYLESNDYEYVVIAISFEDPDNLGYEKIVNQILSTFRFLD